MMRAVAAAVTIVVAFTALSACGGDSPYCGEVKDHVKTLKSFGNERTDAGYTSYAGTLRDIAEVAPSGVSDDWKKLAKVTQDVLDAQKDVGLRLEQMNDTAEVKKLSTDQLKKLNDAYEAFNSTTDQRSAVVENVQKECDVSLK